MLVIKIGGSEGTDYQAICSDVAQHVRQGEQIVLVHGGSHETNILSEALDHPPRFVTSVSGHTSRYTDRQTMEIFLMAVAGKVNSLLVEALQREGINAFGLSGMDGRVLQAKRKDAIRIIENGKKKILRNDYTGRIKSVNADLIISLLNQSLVPVIAPIAISDTGDAVNCDGDRAAAEITAALNAEKLIIFTNVPGLLQDVNDESTLIRDIPRAEFSKYAAFAEGRMKKKLLGAEEALAGGVNEIRLTSGTVEQPLSHALGGHCTVIH